MATYSSGGSKSLRVRRAPVDSIDIYEVKDSELEILEKGGPAATQLNLAVFAFTMAFSSFVALSTATFEPDIMQTFCVVTAIVGLLMGVYCSFQWRQSGAPIKKVVGDIRKRMTEDAADSQSDPLYRPPPSPPSIEDFQ